MLRHCFSQPLFFSNCNLYKSHIHTVVWEKLVVGNIHEKKFRGKKIFVSAGYKPL